MNRKIEGKKIKEFAKRMTTATAVNIYKSILSPLATMVDAEKTLFGKEPHSVEKPLASTLDVASFLAFPYIAMNNHDILLPYTGARLILSAMAFLLATGATIKQEVKRARSTSR
jgi:hypothetical protein